MEEPIELRRLPRHVKNLLAGSRKVTDGRGNVNMYTGHACHHYEEVMFALADSEVRDLVAHILKDELGTLPDTPAMREAHRTLVGFGTDDEDVMWVAVCRDSHCYPSYWSNQHIAACEVFVHGIVSQQGPITAYTTPGPQAHCRKMCYKRTPHFFDVEVWDQPDRPAYVGEFSGDSYPTRPAGRKYQIVLRCEECHHGWDLVTKEGSPSRWRRLMKDETARRLLKGAVPDR